MLPESMQYLIIRYLHLETKHLLVSKDWFAYIKHYTRYIFDNTRFHKNAEKTKSNVEIKSYFHYIHVKNKQCCICAEHYAGKFHTFWKIFAHEACIRNSIINIFYLTETESSYINSHWNELLLQEKHGYRHFVREKYKYYCIWEHKFPLIPYNQTLQYIKEIPEIYLKNHKLLIKKCVQEIKIEMKKLKIRAKEKINYHKKLTFIYNFHIEMYKLYTEDNICAFLQKKNIDVHTIQIKDIKKKSYKKQLIKDINEFTKSK